MTEFQKITASPEALTELLASILTTDGPWEEAWSKLTAPTASGRTATAARMTRRTGRGSCGG